MYSDKFYMVERDKMRVKFLQQLRNETLKALSSVIISLCFTGQR